MVLSPRCPWWGCGSIADWRIAIVVAGVGCFCEPPVARIGHRSSVYGKPPTSAGQSISRPTPLAPWRGPRGWGLGGGDASRVQLEKTYRSPRPRRNVAKPSAPPGRRPGSLIQRLQRPNRPFSSYLPPRAAYRQAQTHPVGRPQTARQPRRQRRVARPSGHRDSVHGKPRKAAHHAISRPAPLAPWRGSRGWGLGGARYEPALAQKTKQHPATAPQRNEPL